MNKQQKYLILFTFLFFAAAIGFDYYSQRIVSTQQYAYEIEKYLHENEAKVISFFSNKELIHRQLTNTTTEEDYQTIQNLFNKDYTLCLYQNDSLVFWSNNNILSNDLLLEVNTPDLYSEYFHLSNAHYEIIKQSFTDPTVGQRLPVESNLLKEGFLHEIKLNDFRQNTIPLENLMPNPNIKITGDVKD